MDNTKTSIAGERTQPPIDNEHVAEGCEQFGDGNIESEITSGSKHCDYQGNVLGGCGMTDDADIIPVTKTALQWLLENTRDNARVQNFVARILDTAASAPTPAPAAADAEYRHEYADHLPATDVSDHQPPKPAAAATHGQEWTPETVRKIICGSADQIQEWCKLCDAHNAAIYDILSRRGVAGRGEGNSHDSTPPPNFNIAKWKWTPSMLQEPCYRSDEAICRDHNDMLEHAVAAAITAEREKREQSERCLFQMQEAAKELAAMRQPQELQQIQELITAYYDGDERPAVAVLDEIDKVLSQARQEVKK